MLTQSIMNTMSKIDYKYNEDKLLNEFASYVDKTYAKHYSKDKYQSTEFIIDSGHGEGFCFLTSSSVAKPNRTLGKPNYSRVENTLAKSQPRTTTSSRVTAQPALPPWYERNGRTHHRHKLSAKQSWFSTKRWRARRRIHGFTRGGGN